MSRSSGAAPRSRAPALHIIIWSWVSHPIDGRPAGVAALLTRVGLLLLVAVVVLPLLLGAASPAAAASSPAPARGVWPLQPRPAVVRGFDPPETRFGAGHRGVDLAGSPGQPVHTAVAGRVTFAGRIAGRGVVVVDHGTTRTTYEPVAASVSVGDVVGAGAVLGRLELAGSHCFPRACLHWGLIEGEERYLDPLTLVGAAPVRLLPLFSALPALASGSPLPPPRAGTRFTAASATRFTAPSAPITAGSAAPFPRFAPLLPAPPTGLLALPAPR